MAKKVTEEESPVEDREVEETPIADARPIMIALTDAGDSLEQIRRWECINMQTLDEMSVRIRYIFLAVMFMFGVCLGYMLMSSLDLED